MKPERHILALSGGKDSAALAVYMREKHPDMPLEYVFIDSGHELPETYEFLDKIRAVLNIQIICIRPTQDFDYWLKVFRGVLPSPNNRWCTRELKLKPYRKWMKENCAGVRVYSYVGLRADEDRKGYRPDSDSIVPVYPFIEDGLVLCDIKRILADSGLGLPSYYEWRNRSGCFFCFYQRDTEWRGLRRIHPDLFDRACLYEENHADGREYTWRDTGLLRELHEGNSGPASPESKKLPLLSDLLADVVQSVSPERLEKWTSDVE
ncbi:MAG: phosphoadenosine phosphosulfate reductase family protein [Candidatus Sumerlaeota bacterium]|nr:phosphoadenosine phosphosulfate reductase family protein [Candidatus Sumerlaeota bacterium]